MLQIIVPPASGWDEEKEEFVPVGKPFPLQLEHSLVSLSKWEAKYHKPYLSSKEKTPEEIIDYIRCMTLTQNVPPAVYNNLSQDNIVAIGAYINDPMTATTVKNMNKKRSSEQITSELIYYWMVALQIPFECQKWHLNRLLTLVEVCSVKNQPSKKMDKHTAARQNAALNAARRQKAHSSG